MSCIAVDFGTSNSVLARLSENDPDARTLELPGVTKEVVFESKIAGELPGLSEARRPVHVIPTLIHYGETQTLVGEQVLAAGLLEHPWTMRWMKRGIAYNVSKRRKTPQGHKTAADAGLDFLRRLLTYVSESVSFTDDEFVFTAPVEAFEDFRDWLERVAEALGIRRVRLMDEATATILGYLGAARSEDRFLIFDCGCGTLDISAVRLDLTAEGAAGGRTAVQLGQAGRDLGGMDVDRWIAADFARRHRLDEHDRKRLDPLLHARAERLKVQLATGHGAESLCVSAAEARQPGALATEYVARCATCDRHQVAPVDESPACLGCILTRHDFLQGVRETVERALENAAIRAGLRKSEITAVLATGGTSLLPCVRDFLQETFPAKVTLTNPFDSVVHGACRGVVVPLLPHDYAIESYDGEKKGYEFKPLFAAGATYPTPPDAVRLWARGSYDGMTRIGIKIFEVSRLRRRTLDRSLVDDEGVLVHDSKVTSDYHYICLNHDNPTFIVADPPVSLARDSRRFLCSFRVDGNRRLLVTVVDNHTGKLLFEDHAVVRL